MVVYSYNGIVIGNMMKQATQKMQQYGNISKTFCGGKSKTQKSMGTLDYANKCLRKTRQRADQWFLGIRGSKWQLIMKSSGGSFLE